MAYTVIADYRTATLAEYCQGLALTTAEAPDALLTPAIARMAARLDMLTNDQFESVSSTYDLRGDGTPQLELPQRCTAVTTVKTRDYLGNLTTQVSTSYRLVSSLNAGGDTRITLDAIDYIEVIPFKYLLGVIGPWWAWPQGPQTVQVVGTFGWTVTPPDIKRAMALMVFDHFKNLQPGLRRATAMQTAAAMYTYQPQDSADHPTGIDEADDIIVAYRRSTGLLVG